jgi:CBS domain-containing protein
MARRPPLPGAALLRRRRERTTDRLLARRAVRDALVSLAGLINRPVRNRAGGEIGRLVDVVARWDGHVRYPPITGLVVRIARRHAWVPADQIERLTHDEIVLRSARLDLRDFERREGEVMLGKDVLDHQLVDVDGVQVIRASDLYLAPVGTRILLVGADVGIGSLLRRLGPARWRSRATPGRVVDWAAIQPFSGPTGHVRLRESHEGLQRLRPGELADLLEDLGRDARQELLESLDPEAAADALEEMEPGELESLLREANPEQAAALLAAMEPDEAVDALRDLAVDERNELLERMPSDIARQLAALLGYDERQAGGIMTTHLVVIPAADTVMQAKQALAEMAEHKGDIDAIVVVDGYGRLVDDVGLFDFSLAADDVRLGQLVDESPCVTVTPDADLEEVASRLIENRRSSLLVVDGNELPVGRILADDVIDALVPERGRFRFPRLLQK